ncbi:MAG: LamG domain-containing protein, partial [Dolichospermum sp.]
MPTLGKTKVSPSLISTGSTFQGTSSYAVTASFALNASGGGGGGSVQTGSIAKQTILYNVTSGSTNTISGLSLSSNKWDVSVVEEWDAATLDQYYNSSSLLCHFDSLNPAGRFIDSSRNNFAITSSGDSRLSTSQYKFGGASAYFDGTADNLLINYNNAFNLSGDFTIEVWFYPITLNGGMILNFAGGFNIAWASYELVNNTDGINFAGSSANNGYDIGSETGATGRIGTVSVNTWNHIAVTRQGNVYRGFVNGVQGYTQTLALTPYNPNARGLAIGSNYANTWGVTPATVINGYLDELRITKGVARYTSNFTPSSLPFPNSRNQVLTKYVGLVG